ncbi:MAG: hypothetical protein NVS9B10_22300 [Nevskia sp.]
MMGFIAPHGGTSFRNASPKMLRYLCTRPIYWAGEVAVKVPLDPRPPRPRMPKLLDIGAPDPLIRSAARRLASIAIELVESKIEAWKAHGLIAKELCEPMRVAAAMPKKWQEGDPSDGSAFMPAIRRMCSSRWWRRRLRVSVAQRCEAHYIAAGRVRRMAQVYCSDLGVDRRRRSAQRNADLLSQMVAENLTTGEVVPLADIAASTVSADTNRRNELMTRIKGLEALADERGDRALFVTWTLPSRFHAVHSGSGLRNEKYDGSTPVTAARFFGAMWARVRAGLAKADIRLYGLRVAEPHHDGTPHWHMLLFAPVKRHAAVVKAISREAFSEGADEPGAKKHRLTCKLISRGLDPKTGKPYTAVGYVAKYLAKNVDGFQLEMAMERGADGELRFTDRAVTAAERIRAWASHWRIRQFQFFGAPPVTWWRELRRLDEPCAVPAIEAARLPADEGDYAGHVRACGGVAVALKLRPLSTYREPAVDADGVLATNAYGEVRPDAVKGLAAGLGRVITRLHTWVLSHLSTRADSGPWTRVNNCNQPKGGSTDAESEDAWRPQRTGANRASADTGGRKAEAEAEALEAQGAALSHG